MKKILLDIAIMVVFVATLWFVYVQYGDQVIATFFGEERTTIYIGETPISVSIADEPAEHRQGLSGTAELPDFVGKLFIFPQPDYYGIWMKDMNYAIDILWIDNDFRVVHLEENVAPETYPDTFAPETPARFVLETNAFFARDNTIELGDMVRIPIDKLPTDLKERLQ